MALLEFQILQGNHPPGPDARGMGISWLCQEEVIHIGEGVFPLVGFQAPESMGNGANPCLSGSTVRPGDAGNGTLLSGGKQIGKEGPPGRGQTRPSLHLRILFLPEGGGNGAFRIIHRSGEPWLVSLPGFPSSGRGGCWAGGISLPDWICRRRRGILNWQQE
jgi:hypothetical protein